MVCPQLTSSTGTPRAAAIFCRSAGLGVILASQSPADFDYRLRDLVNTWLVGRIGDKRSVDKMRPLFERRPQAASKLTQLSEGHFVLLQDVTVGLQRPKDAELH